MQFKLVRNEGVLFISGTKNLIAFAQKIDKDYVPHQFHQAVALLNLRGFHVFTMPK